MARDVPSKTEVEIELDELVENHYHGAIGIDARQSAYALTCMPRVLIVDMDKVVVNYQDVRIVEHTLLSVTWTICAHRFLTAQQLVYGFAHRRRIRHTLEGVSVRRDLLNLLHVIRRYMRIVVTYENGITHFDELQDN